MRKTVAAFLTALVIGIGAGALADGNGTVTLASERQFFTRTPPDSGEFGTGNSLALDNLNGFRVSICADGGTLTSTCRIEAYWFDDRNTKVNRNVELDHSLSGSIQSDCGGQPCGCAVFPDQTVTASTGGRVMYATRNCYVIQQDGGPQLDGGYLDIRYFGWNKRP